MVQATKPPGAGVGQWLEQMTGLPAPDKVMLELQAFRVEMQRLNSNLEKMGPDLHTLAEAAKGLNAGDLRSLNQTLQGVKLGDAVKAMTELAKPLKRFVDKLMGPG